MARILAVAHQTSESPEFVEAVVAASREDDGAEFVLLIPATPVEHMATWSEGESNAVAEAKAGAARKRLEEEGVTVVDALVGDRRPYEAVLDTLRDGEYDAIIVSTFPPGISRWLGMDLIKRLQRAVSIPLTHVVAES